MLIFESGHIIITGVKTGDELVLAFDATMRVMNAELHRMLEHPKKRKRGDVEEEAEPVHQVKTVHIEDEFEFQFDAEDDAAFDFAEGEEDEEGLPALPPPSP